MKKILIGAATAVVLGGAFWYFQSGSDGSAAPTTTATSGNTPGGRGRGGRGMVPMTVDTAAATRGEVVDYITVVGNLVGEATVDVVPRVAGRIEAIHVRLGDRVSRGQTVTKIEDRALREQLNQVQANLEVNRATVIARENDTAVARNSLDRARTSFERGLVSQQGLEDAEARYNSAVSQVTVAQAQLVSTQARFDELSVTLSDTNVVSPVDGFVGRRHLDQGAFAGANTPIISVVDIGTVRLVANLVERDFRRVQQGAPAQVDVDAFPGEQFSGQVSRVAPVFDPATRTATMEIEVPNPGFRLKPGMYARVRLLAERRPDALTVARSAVVDIQGRRGVYVVEEDVAHFREVQTGVADAERIEITAGIDEGTRVVTTGALAIRDGERIIVTDTQTPAQNAGGRGRAGQNGVIRTNGPS